MKSLDSLMLLLSNEYFMSNMLVYINITNVIEIFKTKISMFEKSFGASPSHIKPSSINFLGHINFEKI